MWVYTVFPFLGSALAALLFYFHEQLENPREKDSVFETTEAETGKDLNYL